MLTQVEEKLQWPKATGRCLDTGFLASMARILSNLVPNYGNMLNRHERRTQVLLDETTADDSATLDVGNIDWDPLWGDHGFLLAELRSIKPTTDGNTLRIRYGGGGSWWTSANYDYAYYVLGVYSITGVGAFGTFIPCWDNGSSAYTQGNANYEEVCGFVRCSLADADGATANHSLRAELEWRNSTAASDLESVILTGAYRTTSHITAVRFYYETGNVASGTVRLWGLPKGAGLL